MASVGGPGLMASYQTFALHHLGAEFESVAAESGFADGMEWAANLLRTPGEGHLGRGFGWYYGIEVVRNLGCQAVDIAAVAGTLGGEDTEHWEEDRN